MPTASTKQLPSAAEIIASNESKQLYRTNLLRLQLDELYSNITPVYTKLTKVDKLISSVSDSLKSVKESNIPADCRHVFPNLSFQSPMQSSMAFCAPIAVDVVGSYKSRSIVKPLQAVDIAFTIPKTCFAAKDFKAGRYFDRRTAYCGELCRQLRLLLPSLDFSVESSRIVISVPESLWKINLIPCLEKGTFGESKLGLDYCNLKESTECDPLYNASILSDMVATSFCALSKEVLHFSKAVQLVKVWLHRRNALGGITGYHIEVLLSHICKSVPREISAYQLFKLFLVLVSSTDWRSEVLVLGKKTRSGVVNKFPTMECEDTIFNPLWNVPMFLMEEVVVHAKNSLQILDEVDDVYESLFGKRNLSFDFELKLKKQNTVRANADSVFEIFKIGLKSRVDNFSLRFDLHGITLAGNVVVGNHDLVDKGPSADSAEAREFAKFWGKKSQLRRFKDGSILECVVWSPEKSVIEQIVEYLCAEKFADFEVSSLVVTPLAVSTKPAVALWAMLEKLRLQLTTDIQLPLSIVDLRPSDPRFTATHSTEKAHACVLEFESSPSWPENKTAIWHSKCAFLLAIRDGLLATNSGQVEIGATDPLAEPFVDIRVAPNTVFRLHVFVLSEKLIVERAMESSVPPSMHAIASVSQLWFLPALRAKIHAKSIESPGICGAIQAAKKWMDNHLLLEPYLGPWVECTMAIAASSSSSHALMMNWLFLLAHHAWRTTPLFWDATPDMMSKFDEAVDHRKNWWVASDLDPHCIYLRRPSEWESVRIETLARKALLHAEAKQWEKIKFHTDNSAVFDLLFTVKGNDVAEIAKLLNEQFRKYFTFHYSETHRIIGVVFDGFALQSGAAAKSNAMITVVDNLAVPDFTVLVEKMKALLKGSVSSVKVKKI